MTLTRLRYNAPGWGVGELWLAGETLVAHDLPRPSPPPQEQSDHPLAARFRAYFAGARDGFADVAIDEDALTPFARRLAAALRAVAPGETVTYGELAARAGRPGAARAAGTFCARNAFGLVVPCHRVVAAGGLGGYGSLGGAYKRRLLELER